MKIEIDDILDWDLYDIHEYFALLRRARDFADVKNANRSHKTLVNRTHAQVQA